MKRLNLFSVLAPWLAAGAVGAAPRPAIAAGPDDPAAWTVQVRAEQIDALVPWNGLLAGADEFGGLVLLDPATRALEVLTTRDGLSVNDLRDLAIDAEQNLWVASAGGGLVRFDTQRNPRRVTGLVDLSLTAVAVEGDVLFYGTANAGGGRVVGGLPDATYTVADGLIDPRIRAVAVYSGRAWFGTNAGVSEFSANVFTTRDQGLGVPFVYDLVAGAPGVFVATDLGVNRFDDATSSWVPAGTGLGGGIRTVAFAGDDLLALGFAGGGQQTLYRLPAGTTVWQATSVPAVQREYVCVAQEPATGVWLAGRLVDPIAAGQDPRGVFHQMSADADVVLRRMFGSSVRERGCIDDDGAGGVWIATDAPRSGLNHLRADGSVAAYALVTATAGTGFCSTQSKRAVKRARDGSLWISNIGTCVTRLVPHASDDPAQATYDNYTTANSGILTRRVVMIGEDSLGRLWFLSDGGDTEGDPLSKGLDVLLDPSDPVSASSWLHVRKETSELAGDIVRNITFDTGGVVWLCESGEGVQRWDTDGPDGSESIASTATNPFRWDRITGARLTSSGIRGMTLAAPSAVAVATDGSLWLATGDEGLLHMDYASGFPWRQLDRLQQRLFGPGLLSANVNALAMDGVGNLWVATASGLNRVRGTGADLVVDAYTTVPAYDGELYTPDVISPLPGSNLFALHYEAARDVLHVGTQTGYASIQLDAATAEAQQPEVFLYPNPLREGHAGLRVGGFTGRAIVRVFNILGTELVNEQNVQAGDLVWNGKYVSSSAGATEDLPAASGMYVVVIEVDGRRIQRTLAIER